MCTVSYLPLKVGGYIITSNRDEAPHRNAIHVQRITLGGQSLLFPKDPHAGGSWFCVSDHDKVACILNGAFIPYTPDPRYTHSRGKVLIDILQHPSVQHFREHYDLSLTAPFTLVLAEDGILNELIWDGSTLHTRILDTSHAAFWSSVTLYPEEVRAWRRSLFEKWLAEHEEFTQAEIMRFHRYGSTDDHWNGFVMNRQERVKTLSITSVQKIPGSFALQHHDLMNGDMHSELLHLAITHVAEN